MNNFWHLKIAKGLGFELIGDFIKFEYIDKVSKIFSLNNTIEIPYRYHNLLKISS